jgi:hypothetical protein
LRRAALTISISFRRRPARPLVAADRDLRQRDCLVLSFVLSFSVLGHCRRRGGDGSDRNYRETECAHDMNLQFPIGRV